jgi:hypothetical protein
MVRRPSIRRQLNTALENPKGSAQVGIGRIQQFFLDLFGIGDEIYSEPWDLLVILDACRLDVMRDVADEYSFIDEVDSRFSKGSTSRQWMRRNFTDEWADDIKNTAYITANTFSDEMFDEDEFEYFDQVWKYAVDEEMGVVSPRTMTDRAISCGRELDVERMIIHYMQPHQPLVTNPDFDYFSKLRNGEITREEAIDAYTENLRAVLDDVE